ncbi:hypothetical protein V1515DRAFT_609949 [Lipomyces mesembrius]
MMLSFPRQYNKALRIVSICSIVPISVLLFLVSPLSSLTSLHGPSPNAPTAWLIATISPAHSQRRRNIIRATWQSLYEDPAITTRFVISDPGELWAPLIRHENATYGDIIVLSHLNETAHIANTIKSMELFRYLVESGFHWQFVSKLDDDSFLDVSTFYRSFILPILDTRSHDLIIIGRRLTYRKPHFDYPGGQFYTLTWEMTTRLVHLYTLEPIADEHEDVLVGRLLDEAGVSWELVELDNPTAFDYDEKNTDVLANRHAVLAGAINPHKMKDDETYLKVAAMYDSHGLRPES